MFEPFSNLFSRRMRGLKGELPDFYSYSLSNSVKQKIIYRIIGENFSIQQNYLIQEEGYDELYDFGLCLERELGRGLSSEILIQDKVMDFMIKCHEDEFLSALELLCALKVKNIYRFERYSGASRAKLSNLINATNKIFKLEKIGYEIVPVNLDELPFIVIPFNSQYLYLETIRRPMSLLYNENFKGPLNEFETALDKYRKEDYEGAIIEASNAYESTLKTILTFKKIQFDEKSDKIPHMVDKIISANMVDSIIKTSFDSFWPILKVGPNNIRNLAGIAHGQGVDVKKAQKEYADFVLRTVGTYMVFLIERYEENK